MIDPEEESIDEKEKTYVEAKDELKAQQEEIQSQRQVLPRESKARHKVLSEGAQNAKATGPSNMSKKGTRKNNH